jgi:hypothetical protein
MHSNTFQYVFLKLFVPMKKIYSLLLLFIISAAGISNAQTPVAINEAEKDSLLSIHRLKLMQDRLDNNSIMWERVIFTTSATAAVNIALWNYYNTAWYTGEKTKMHSVNDWYSEKLNIDKLGHLHGAVALHKGTYHLLRWSNFREEQAMWIAGATAWLMQLQIELSDSRFKSWGFSWHDLGANTIGALYPSLQYYFPELQSFNFKVSYYPSDNYRNGQYKHLIDDYEGKVHWLSINVHNFLPENFQKYYPDWLNLAVGYGGDRLLTPQGSLNKDHNGKGLGVQEWFIAFDYDLLKLFDPKKGTFWYGLIDMLNLIHLPAPAIRIQPTGIFYGLYF